MNPDALRHKRIEWLTPQAIDLALAEASILYLPLGTYEWHGRHLPIGLDSLKAHQLCLEAAERSGGLVCPPLYYGTGGAHGPYPWTVMMDDDSHIRPLLRKTLERFEDFGIGLAVLFTGHFAGEQVEMVRGLETQWNDEGHKMRVLALSDAMLPEPPLAPDHAAIYETSMMMALDEESVKIGQLPDAAESPAQDPDGNTWGEQRHDPGHVLYGIFGPDPRRAEPVSSRQLRERCVQWLADTAAQAARQR